jgi:hypothetical protein
MELSGPAISRRAKGLLLRARVRCPALTIRISPASTASSPTRDFGRRRG